MGQTERYPARADLFRSSSNNGHWFSTRKGVTRIDGISLSLRPLLQQSRDVSISAKLKCHSAASLGALAGAAETSISQRRRLTRAFRHDLAASVICKARFFRTPGFWPLRRG